MPLGLAIMVLVLGIFLGSIFTFGMHDWNQKVTREACSKIQTQFVDYKNIRNARRATKVKEIAIDCANGERYFLDGAFVIFYANTPLFVGTIAGILAIAALVIFLIKRKGGKKSKAAAKA